LNVLILPAHTPHNACTLEVVAGQNLCPNAEAEGKQVGVMIGCDMKTGGALSSLW